MSSGAVSAHARNDVRLRRDRDRGVRGDVVGRDLHPARCAHHSALGMYCTVADARSTFWPCARDAIAQKPMVAMNDRARAWEQHIGCRTSEPRCERRLARWIAGDEGSTVAHRGPHASSLRCFDHRACAAPCARMLGRRAALRDLRRQSNRGAALGFANRRWRHERSAGAGARLSRRLVRSVRRRARSKLSTRGRDRARRSDSPERGSSRHPLLGSLQRDPRDRDEREAHVLHARG